MQICFFLFLHSLGFIMISKDSSKGNIFNCKSFKEIYIKKRMTTSISSEVFEEKKLKVQKKEIIQNNTKR